jgi:hypothetical protein
MTALNAVPKSSEGWSRIAKMIRVAAKAAARAEGSTP